MADIKLKNTANTEFSISHNGTRGAKAVTSDQIVVAVETIVDFPANAETGDTVIVKDQSRGGTFIYNATQSAVNNGGTIFDGWVRQYSGAVNVKWFGAKGDGVTDDTVAVQSAIDFCMSGVSGVGSAYKSESKKLEVEAGIYLISSELIIYKSNFILSGIGVPTFIGTSSLSNEEFIIKTGLTKSGTFVEAYNIVIENIKFERKTSNPYKSDYNSTAFGSGASYTFINSCNGVYFGDSHYSYIKNCSFIGLRLAIKQMGSWLSYIEDCTFSYNDRHIYGANSIYGAKDSNNANVISRCTFGSSIMVGGVYLEQYDDLTFENIDYEQSHQTPFVLRQCRNVQFNGYLYLETNSKYFGNVSSPSHIGDSSSFMPIAGTGEIVAGKAIYSTNIICGASKNVVINNISNQYNSAPTLVVSLYNYNDIILNSPAWFSNGTSFPTNNMVIVHQGDVGFTLNNVDTVYWHKISTDAKVKVYGELTDNINFSCPKVWYIDTVNGSANIPTNQMSELNPLSASSFICLPQNNSYTFNINNVSSLRLPLNYEDINIIGLGDAKAIYRILSYGSCRNLNITGIVMSDTIHNYGSIDTLKIKSCAASYNAASGFLSLNKPTNVFIYSSSFTNSNEVYYTMVVENQKLFVKDTYCNKQIEGRNGSLIYYKNVTGTVPYSNATVYLSKIESM